MTSKQTLNPTATTASAVAPQQQQRTAPCRNFAAGKCKFGADCRYSHSTTPYCVYCKTEGHNVDTCPALQCKNCNEQGHTTKKCPHPAQKWQPTDDGAGFVAKQSSNGGAECAVSQQETATCRVCCKVLPRRSFSHNQWQKKLELPSKVQLKCWECSHHFHTCHECGLDKNNNDFAPEEWDKVDDGLCHICHKKWVRRKKTKNEKKLLYKENPHQRSDSDYDYDYSDDEQAVL